MKKGLCCLIALMLCFSLFTFSASADGSDIDWSDYTLDELLEIQQDLDAVIYERQKEYAREHGDRVITLSEEELVLNVGGRATLTASVENTFESAPAKTVLVWKSSDEEVAKVANGVITAIAPGEAIITCCAEDNEFILAECPVNVIQMVTGIKILDVTNPVTLNKDDELELSVEITPENATDPTLTWTSSDDSVVSVSEDGVLYAENGGSATITCTAADGSEKTATVNVFVPSISIDQDTYEVTEKTGMSFSAKFYGEAEDFEITPDKTNFFTTEKSISGEDVEIKIIPQKAGKAVITLRDKRDLKNDRKVTIDITHDAVFDLSSYPAGNYENILRNPDENDGKKISVYGKVLQKMEGEYLGIPYYTLRVGTTGYGYYDNVFYVTVFDAIQDQNVIEEDLITVFGECTGTYTYTAVRGNSITIPALTAEKIVSGRFY